MDKKYIPFNYFIITYLFWGEVHTLSIRRLVDNFGSQNSPSNVGPKD